MTSLQTGSGRIRLGVLLLPLAFIFIVIGTVVGYPGFDPHTVQGYAELVSSTRYAIGAFLISIGFLLSIFGYMSLYAYIANNRAGRWITLALVLCVIGAASGFAHFAGTAGPEAVAAQQYLEGQRTVLEEWYVVTDWSFILTTFNFAVLFPIGLLILGVMIWRCPPLPQGAAILWIAHVLLFLGNGPLGWWVGAISFLLAIVAGAWISWAVWRQPSTQVAGTEAEARVR